MELFFFKSNKNNDLTDNGGSLSKTPVINNLKENILPDINPDESEEGIIRLRKIFLLPEYELLQLRIFLDNPSGGADGCLLNVGTEDDTKTDAENYLRWKGAGTLKTAISAGIITTLIVESEVSGEGFNALDLIKISDGDTEEFVRVYSVSWNNKIATLTLFSDSFVDNSYSAGSYVSACIEKGVSGSNAIWLKEVVPVDSYYKRDNTMRIRFIL